MVRPLTSSATPSAVTSAPSRSSAAAELCGPRRADADRALGHEATDRPARHQPPAVDHDHVVDGLLDLRPERGWRPAARPSRRRRPAGSRAASRSPGVQGASAGSSSTSTSGSPKNAAASPARACIPVDRRAGSPASRLYRRAPRRRALPGADRRQSASGRRGRSGPCVPHTRGSPPTDLAGSGSAMNGHPPGRQNSPHHQPAAPAPVRQWLSLQPVRRGMP